MLPAKDQICDRNALRSLNIYYSIKKESKNIVFDIRRKTRGKGINWSGVAVALAYNTGNAEILVKCAGG